MYLGILGTSLVGTHHLYYYLDNHLPCFSNISPNHKKWYVISNLSKSMIFSIYSYHAYFILYNYIINNIWNTNDLLFLGSLYAAVDMNSIIIVPKLSRNTLYHHIVVNVLFFYTILNGMNVDSFARLIVVYALFSVLAVSVNFYLACRVIWKDNKHLEYMSSFCFVNYVCCCIPNWSFQFYHLCLNPFFINSYHWITRLLFLFIIIVVVYDDLVLMKYLKDHSFFRNILPLKLISN
jgi:hypothetical protein